MIKTNLTLQRDGSGKERDPDQTRRLILDAANHVLMEKGYAFFTIDVIATRAKVAPKLIKHYFGSLNGLLKMLILEKDFWRPVFDNFTVPTDLKTFIKEVLKQQLDYFLTHKEMQSFILWQISEYNPVISSVAIMRDNEGLQILALCKDHFSGSDIDFEAVIALVVAGIYATVLQTQTGNSPMCGIDVRNDRDKMRLYETIDRLIDLAWNAGGERKGY